MWRYLATFCSTLVLLAVYSVYSQFAGGILQREFETASRVAKPVVKAVPSVGPRISQVTAQTYLQDVDWAESARMKIHAHGLHFYFNERQMLQENTGLEVTPVAMVWNPPADADQEQAETEPIIILAERATFLFDQPTELSEIRTHLIRQIMLRGTVSIRSTDGLQVDGENFVFSRDAQHLRSDSPVQFQYHGNSGRSQNIQLNLKMLDGGEYADNPRVQAIEMLSVRDHLELQLSPAADEPPVKVTCEDGMQYLVDRQLAILSQDVQVHRVDPLGLVDSLHCDRLELQFAENSSTQTERSSAALPSLGKNKQSSAVELVSLKATGEDVVARSSAHQLIAVGEELNYHIPDGRLILKKNRGVELEFRGAELFTPRLEIHLNQQSEPTYARCAGPGQLEYWESPSEPDRRQAQALPALLARANWQESLIYQPATSTGDPYDLVTLTGKAVLHSPAQQAGIIAQKLNFWLNRLEHTADSGPSSNQLNMAAGLQLIRTLAEQDVAIASPWIEGEYASLDLQFQEVPASRMLDFKEDQGEIQQVNAETKPESSARANQPPEQPFRVDATELSLQIFHDKTFEQLHLQNVKTTGAVIARGQLNRDQSPIQLEGQSVEIENEGKLQQRFHLQGSESRNATIRQENMRIDGIDLVVDRKQNFSQVKGAGSIEFPVQSDWDGNPLPQPRQLEISWQEQMVFAGNQARFLGTVKATLADAVITCEELVVQLDQPISLHQTNSRIKPQIAQVQCRDRVHFDMQVYEQGELIGLRQLQVAEFQVNHQTGKLFAQGPGIIEYWQKRTGDSKLGLPEAMMKKRPETKPNEATGWDYTQLTFAGQMNGNFQQQYGILNDRVNILHGPVDQALARFDRDHRPPESVWVRCHQLEVLLKDHPEPEETGERWAVEIQARGNAQIEGDQYLARADVIAYDHANQFFILRSLENRHATIWHYEHPQAQRSRYDVKMIRLSPDGNILELDQTLGASGGR